MNILIVTAAGLFLVLYLLRRRARIKNDDT